MKQDRLAAPPAAGRACAAFSFAGFWRENQATLLLAVVAVAVVAALPAVVAIRSTLGW